MTWSEIAEELSAEVERLQPLLKAQKENICQGADLIELEKRCFCEIDDACQKFAESGKWPALDQSKAVLAYSRLVHAALFVDFLSEAPDSISMLPIEDMRKATVLNFLLLDYWRFAGCARWRTS